MSKITKYLRQEKTNLICNQDCTLTIDLSNYDMNNNIKISDEYIWVKGLVSQIEFEDFMFKIVLDYPVNIQTYKIEKVKGEYIKVHYKKDDTILETTVETQAVNKQVLYVERLIGGKEVYKDVDHLFKKLFTVYSGSKSDMDLVHMEVLLSQCLRDKSDPQIPARLGSKWDPMLMNLKKIVFNSGFIQGLSFENIGEAIKVGFTTDQKMEPSIIEKVMTGTIVEKKKR